MTHRNPTQNGVVASFNGRFHEECLNEHWFRDLAHARKNVNSWRHDYEEGRAIQPWIIRDHWSLAQATDHDKGAKKLRHHTLNVLLNKGG